MLSTCDWGAKKIVTCDICRSFLIYATFDMGEKVTRHATLSLLKIDMRHGDPLSRAPHGSLLSTGHLATGPCLLVLEGMKGRGEGGTQPLEASM